MSDLNLSDNTLSVFGRMANLFRRGSGRSKSENEMNQGDGIMSKDGVNFLTNGGKKNPLVSTISGESKEPVRSGDSITNVAVKLYSLLKKDYESDKLKSELETNFRKEREGLRDKRSKELLDEINKKAQKPKKQEIEKAVKDPKEKTRPEVLKNKEPTKQPAKETTKETAKEAPKETPKQPAAPKEAVKEVPKKTAEPATAPKPAEVKPTTSTKTTTPTPAATPTASKVVQNVVAPVAAVALSAATTAAIGAAESGGNYNVTFGDRVGKDGQIVGKYDSPEKLIGKKLTDMTLEEVEKFGRMRPDGTGAVGKYQFMPTTLFGRKMSNGKFAPGLVQMLKLDMKTVKFDAKTQDELQQALRAQDVATLKRLNVPITPGYEYMAHYIGAGGAAAVHRSILAGENLTVAEVMIANKFKIGVNPELYRIRAHEFEKILEERLTKKGGVTPHSSMVEETSKENKALKAQAKTTTNNTTVNNINNTTITSVPPKNVVMQPKSDASPVITNARE